MEMNLGISSYCLYRKMESSGWTLFDIMDWAKANGCTHLEIVPFGLKLFDDAGKPDLEFARKIRDHAEKIGLPLSAFSLNAHVVASRSASKKEREAHYRTEVERIKAVMEIVHAMGIRKMRHDVCSGQQPDGLNTPEQFEEDFPVMVEAVRECADYAKNLGMRTTLENHGLYVNGADRVIRLLLAAGRDNVGLTVDVGNFLCVDEDPVACVSKTIAYADMIHLKDFYIRDSERMIPQSGMYGSFSKDYAKAGVRKVERPTDWDSPMPSLAYVETVSRSRILRGAIVGQGDMDLWKILSLIKKAGYKQEISLEFEGMEDCVAGTYYGLETARYIWERI